MYLLLNPSSASAGLKLVKMESQSSSISSTIKPFFGFGWIETLLNDLISFSLLPIKPFFGFGWIAPPNPQRGRSDKVPFGDLGAKPFFGFGWIETRLVKLRPHCYIFD